VKSLLITAGAVSLVLIFFFYRRRLRFAVTVAAVLYLTVTAARLLILREESDRMTELGLALGGLGLVWLLTNLVTGLLQKRRRRRRIRR
jgi:hypothetical protein